MASGHFPINRPGWDRIRHAFTESSHAGRGGAMVAASSSGPQKKLLSWSYLMHQKEWGSIVVRLHGMIMAT
jgi:hypothetical protein